MIDLKGRRVIIVGTGKSGIGSAVLLEKNDALPVLYDGNENTDKEKVKAVLTEKLGISSGDILFDAYEGSEELTYQCRVWMQDGNCREFRYLARYSERPYLDEYPQMGKVHPSTGYIQVWVNGEECLNREISTDLEQIWDIYQKQVLPECRTYIEEKTHGAANSDMQPFFQKL